METSCTAVLVDTVSIQQYIFSSNRLKENLGASHIIENELFGIVLKNAITKVNGDIIDMDHWVTGEDQELPVFPDNCKVAIGYIGGGNSLLLFKNPPDADQLIREFSLSVLLHYPGIRLAFGRITDFEYNKQWFQQSMEKLHESLMLNKGLGFRNTNLFKPGIVKDCSFSNEALETGWSDDEDISALTLAKYKAAVRASESLERVFGIKGIKLTNNHEDLGQPGDKGYLAVVHIDGNGIGSLFRKCNSLHETRYLSSQVKKISAALLDSLLDYTQNMFTQQFCEQNNFKAIKHLPIRPVISGGDDITFVCEGRLGVHLAEKYIEMLREKTIDLPGGKRENLEACAGIAIVKTNYPFFRVYKLAEKLLDKAKTKSKKDLGNSYLFYMIANSGFVSMDPDIIIGQQFSTRNGNLLYGPYGVGPAAQNPIEGLKKGIREFTQLADKRWPRSKLKEFREVLYKDETEQKYFKLEIQARSKPLVIHEVGGSNDIWRKTNDEKAAVVTPYFDIIELAEFYPSELLDK